MKNIVNILCLAVLFLSLGTATAQEVKSTEERVKTIDNTKVEVYYFHGTRRCETCKAVGDVSKELLRNEYGKNKDVSFIEIDFDELGNEELVEKFEVSSSGLYVYNHEKIINLTTYAFQYAKINPDKLRNRLRNLIDKNL